MGIRSRHRDANRHRGRVWRPKAVLAGVVGAYYATAVVERLLPHAWLRRFQRQFGNPGGEAMARLPGWTVIETTGRQSGLARQVPVGGRMIDGSLWIVAADPRRAAYVRNIEANPRVRVMVRGQWRAGIAHLLAEDNARRRMFQINPMNGLFIGIAGREHLTIRVDLEHPAGRSSERPPSRCRPEPEQSPGT